MKRAFILEDTEAFLRPGLRAFMLFQGLVRLGFGIWAWADYPLAAVWCAGFCLIAGIIALWGRFLALNTVILFMGVDITCFCWGLDRLFGWAAGFDLFALWAVFAVFLFEHLSTKIRVIMGLLPVVLVVGITTLGQSIPPLYEVEPSLSFALRTGNIIYLAVVATAIMAYYSLRLERQKAYAESQAEKRKRLIQAMSHELKTPIAALLTRTQVALESDRRNVDPAMFRAYEKNLQGMGRLIERMLNLSRLESGLGAGEMVAVDLAALIDGLVDLHRPMAEVKHLSWRVETSGLEPIETDPELLNLVLNNLLSNAVRYCEPRGCVTIAAAREVAGYQVSVSDSGPGIAAGDLPFVFEAFYRSDAARSRRENAHGLGLSLAKEAVELLGGSIEVNSTLGQGATFTVRL